MKYVFEIGEKKFEKKRVIYSPKVQIKRGSSKDQRTKQMCVLIEAFKEILEN